MNIDQHIRFEDITVNLIELKVWVGNTNIRLTLTELRVLLALLVDPCQTISFNQLIQRADLVSKDQLQVLIAVLRRRFDHRYIFTERGVGYSFTAPAPAEIKTSGGLIT